MAGVKVEWLNSFELIGNSKSKKVPLLNENYAREHLLRPSTSVPEAADHPALLLATVTKHCRCPWVQVWGQVYRTSSHTWSAFSAKRAAIRWRESGQQSRAKTQQLFVTQPDNLHCARAFVHHASSDTQGPTGCFHRARRSPFIFFDVTPASDKATGRGNYATLMTCDKVTRRWPTPKLSLCFSPFFLPHTPPTLFCPGGCWTAVLRRRKTLWWCFSMSPWSACHPAAAALASSHPPWFL